MTAERFRYDTPASFRAALKEHFGQIAGADGRYPLHELQRQFAYDRALARLFSSDNADRWVLKGAGALLARLATARHSKDIDVLFDVSDAEVDDAVEALLAVLHIDLGDHFRFEVTRVASLQQEAKGARVHVNTRLGPTLFGAFHIDVVVAGVMTCSPDLVAPLTPLVIDGLVRPRYRVFPVADHLADKLCAAVGRYARVAEPVGSTRVKDLVDIVIIATSQTVAAGDLTVAVRVNAAARRLHLPNGSRCPTRSAGVAATRASPRRRPVSLLTTRRPSRSLAFCSIPCSTQPQPAHGIRQRGGGLRSDTAFTGNASACVD